MKRVGVIADNHSRADDGSDLPEAVLEAFKSVDLIVHCGDAGTWGALDRLGTLAPVIAVLGGHNGQGPDKRVLGDRHVFDIEGRRVGVVHDFVGKGVLAQTHPELRAPSGDLAGAVKSFFGEKLDVILYAGTHVPRIAHVAGMFWVNGGSPTIPIGRPKGSLGTVAIADFDHAAVSAQIVDLRYPIESVMYRATAESAMRG